MELQWNNSLIKKSPQQFDVYQDEQILLDNFEYAKVAYFNVSQALRLNTNESNWRDDIERLHVDTGFELGRWSFSFDEYYFYANSRQKSTHQFVSSIGRRFNLGKAALRYEYNGFSSPRRKYLTLEGSLRPVDQWEFLALYRHDMETKNRLNSRYGLIYRPSNNCWSVELNYTDTVLQRRFGFNFYFNFGDSKFNGA